MSTYFKVLGIFIVVFFMITNVSAQFNTKVSLTGLNNTALKERIENNASSFLTDINVAFGKKQKPKFKNNVITNDALTSFLFMWEMSPFRSYEADIIERIVQRPFGGFEVRNIPVFLSNATKDNQYQEIALIFDNQGLVENIYFTLESQRYNEILTFGNDVKEFRRRQIILDFIENFRTAYNRKDINYLQSVFSEDALIITGKVVKVANKDASSQLLSQEIITYQKQTKSDYLSRLKTVFNSNAYVNILFDEITVKQHGLYSSIYGVQFFQEWNTSRYSDAGFIMLVIDFSDEDQPLIHVRTWQPELLNGKRLTESEKFNLDQFNIQK